MNFKGLILVISLFLMLSASVVLAVSSVPSGEFIVTPNSLTIDSWAKTGVINLESNATNNITLNISSASLTNSIGETLDVDPLPSSIDLNTTSLEDNADITLTAVTTGKTPGHYSGSLTVTNNTENATINLDFDLPITFTADGLATVAGNGTTEQSYLFDASSVENTTIMVIESNNTVNMTLYKGATSVATVSGKRLLLFNNTGYLTGNYTLKVRGGLYNISLWLVPFTVSKTISYSNGVGEINHTIDTFNITSTTDLTFALNNIGDYDFDVSNFVNSGIAVKGTDNMTTSTTFTDTTIGSSSSEDVTIQFNQDPITAKNVGIYRGSTAFNLTKGSSWVPINLTVGHELKDELNVEVVSIINANTQDSTPLNKTGSKVEFKVIVKNLNGDFADIINNKTNFDLVLKPYLQEDQTTYLTIQTTTTDLVERTPGTGTYAWNATVSTSAYSGRFIPYVTVRNTRGSDGIGIGSASVANKYIDINGTTVAVNAFLDCTGSSATCTGDDVEGEIDDKFYISVNASNLAANNITNVVLLADLEDCVSLISGGLASTDDEYTIGNLSAFQTNTTLKIWRFKMKSSQDCDIVLLGNSPTGTTWIQDTISVSVTTTDEDDNGGSGGSGGDEGGATGELSIYTSPTYFEVGRGETKTMEIKVRNSLETALLNVGVYVDYVNKDWYKIPTKFNLTGGMTKTVAITFTIPEDAEVGNYSIRFTANTSAVTARANSVLRIVKESTQATTTLTKEQLTTSVDTVEERYQNLLTAFSEVNTTGLDENITSDLNSLKGLIEDARDLIKNGEYTAAENKLNAARDLEAKISEEINALKTQEVAEKVSYWGPIAILLVAVAVIGFLVYVLTPSKAGYIAGRGYTHVPSQAHGKSRVERFTNELKYRWKEKFGKKSNK